MNWNTFHKGFFSNVRFKYAISCNIFFYCLSNIVLVLFQEKSCRFLKHFPLIAIFAIILFCSPSELRKKANTLFGIQFDDAKYSKLGKLLETISEKRELVSSFSDLLNLCCYSEYYFYIFVGNLTTFTYKVMKYSSMSCHPNYFWHWPKNSNYDVLNKRKI